MPRRLSDELTNRQRMCLDYVISCVRRRSLPPTLRELTAHMGSRSSSAAVCHLYALMRKGYIKINGHRSSRAITVLRRSDGEPFVVRRLPDITDVKLPWTLTTAGGDVLQRVPFGLNRGEL